MAIRNKEMWTAGNQVWASLPVEVREEIREVCKVYDRAFVTFYNGEYHVSAGVGIYDKYPSDHRSVGCYFAEDVFTKKERIINYAESFHEFPAMYKGRRDYGIFRNIGWDAKFGFDEEMNLIRLTTAES